MYYKYIVITLLCTEYLLRQIAGKRNPTICDVVRSVARSVASYIIAMD